jgi:hypothetical protein
VANRARSARCRERDYTSGSCRRSIAGGGEAEWGKKLFYRTGQLSLATAWTKELIETRKVLIGHVTDDIMKPDDLARLYPQMNTRGIEAAMSTPSTGVLKAREGRVAVAQAFEKKGVAVTAKVELGTRAGNALQDVALDRRRSRHNPVFACGPLPKVFQSVMNNSWPLRRAVFFYGTPPGDHRFTYPNFRPGRSTTPTGFCIEGRGSRWCRLERELVDPDTQHALTPEELRKGARSPTNGFGAGAAVACRQQDLPARGQRRDHYRPAAPGAGQRLAGRGRIRPRRQARIMPATTSPIGWSATTRSRSWRRRSRSRPRRSSAASPRDP